MTTIDGLPAHVLFNHAVVVLTPLTALLLVLVAVWPAARRKLSIATAVLAVVTLIAVPVTVEAGQWLQRQVVSTPLLRAHTGLGEDLLPWTIGLAVLAVAVCARELLAARSHRLTRSAAHNPAEQPDLARPGTTRGDGGDAGRAPGGTITGARAAPRGSELGGRAASIVLAVLAVVVAVGAVTTVYQIGESGARAVWSGQISGQTQPRPGP